MKKKSILKLAQSVVSLEVIDGTKFLGRIIIKSGKTFHLIKGDKVVVVRRKKVIFPK